MRIATATLFSTWFVFALGSTLTLHSARSASAEPQKPSQVDDIDFSGESKDSAKSRSKSPAEKSDQTSTAGDSKRTRPKRYHLGAIRLEGNLPEGKDSGDPFDTGRGSMLDLMRRLQVAADDSTLDGVVLEIRGPALGRGKVHEVREAIARLRKAGKRVYAHLESASPADYLLACACDEIILPESGDVILPGIRAELTFYKRLFKKLGIEADMLQVGDFKGAAEPYVRDTMSDAFRQQLEHVLDDMYEQMVEEIARDRDLSASQVRELIDVGMFSAKHAKKAGLIDRVAYLKQWKKQILADVDREDLRWTEDYARKKVDMDFSGTTGFFRLIELMTGGKPSRGKSSKPKIAVVYALGPIMTGESGSSLLGGSVMGSDTIIEALEKAEEDESVAAIVLRVDSPGGSALASDLIWNQIQNCEKPIVASMGDVAGSGGYYISMGCDKIFAEPATVTGSIGVVGGKFVTGPMFERFGLTTDIISRGKNSGLFSSNQKFTETERKTWQRIMNEVYDQFTSKAAQGRKMAQAEILKLAGGRIWTGRQAKEHGLVDEIGTLRDAIREAKKMAKIDSDAKTELLILPEAKSLFEQLFGASSPGVGLGYPISGSAQFQREVQLWQRLFAEPALVWMPYRIEIR